MCCIPDEVRNERREVMGSAFTGIAAHHSIEHAAACAHRACIISNTRGFPIEPARSVCHRVRRGSCVRRSLAGQCFPPVRAIASTASAAIPSGSGEYNRLGFTTHIVGTVTRATPRRVYRNPVPEVCLHFAERPLDAQPGIRPAERTALDALRVITRNPDVRPFDVLLRLKTLLRTEGLDFGRIARYASAEPPRVRALLGALGEDLRTEGSARVSARAEDAPGEFESAHDVPH